MGKLCLGQDETKRPRHVFPTGGACVLQDKYAAISSLGMAHITCRTPMISDRSSQRTTVWAKNQYGPDQAG
jgi:hypothetical protein